MNRRSEVREFINERRVEPRFIFWFLDFRDLTLVNKCIQCSGLAVRPDLWQFGCWEFADAHVAPLRFLLGSSRSVKSGVTTIFGTEPLKGGVHQSPQLLVVSSHLLQHW
jgi:hypothetical protein